MKPDQTSGALDENVAGMLAYVTFIPAIVFLNLDPYKQNRFIRFHAFQSLALYAASYLVNMAFSVAFTPLLFMHAAFLIWPLIRLFGLVMVGAWVLCLVKAYNREMFRLPIVGDLAAQLAGN